MEPAASASLLLEVRSTVSPSYPYPPASTKLPTKCFLDFPVRRRRMSYRELAAAKSPFARPTSPPGRGDTGGGQASRSPVVSPSEEGKGPACDPAAATTAPSAAMPGDVVSALGGMGCPPLGSEIADLSLSLSRLGSSRAG